MSVDDVKKINDLAQQLLMKGIASDRVQAVRQAEQMLNKKIASPSAVESVTASSDVDAARVVIQRNKEYMERQLAAFRQELNSLTADVHQMRQQITDMAVNSRIARQEGPRQEVQSPLHQVPTPQKPVMTGPAASHPRMGKWKSDDVSIEKMFYCGNK